MKIVFFLSSMVAGGAERVCANLSNYWVEKGFDITIVTVGSKEKDFYPVDARVHRIYFNLQGDSSNILIALYKNFIRVRAIRQVLKTVQPDVAIGMMTVNNIILGVSAIGLPVRTIGSERSYPAFSPIGRFWNSMRKYTYGLLSAVTTLTSEGQDWLRANTSAKSVVVVPNSAVWPLSSYEPYLPPRRTSKNILLSVGRLVNDKGFDFLIDAYSIIADKHPNWELVIVGEGPLRSMLEAKVKHHGLEDKVFLPGKAGNVGDWYESADLYVLSSRVEGFPNSLVEAMSSGLTAVSFDCNTGPRDIISHEVNGLLVKAEDIEDMAEALDRMLGDEVLRQQLSQKAIDVRDKFSEEKISGLWEKVFQDIQAN